MSQYIKVLVFFGLNDGHICFSILSGYSFSDVPTLCYCAYNYIWDVDIFVD